MKQFRVQIDDLLVRTIVGSMERETSALEVPDAVAHVLAAAVIFGLERKGTMTKDDVRDSYSNMIDQLIASAVPVANVVPFPNEVH